MGAPSRRRLVPLRRRTRPGTRSPDLTNAFAAEARSAPLDVIGILPVNSKKATVPISIVSKWAGHYDAAFTMRTYVHASDDDLKQGRQALAKIHKIA
jgi:hypothetical protein